VFQLEDNVDNNAMQQQQDYNKPPMAQAWDTARQIGSRAANAAGEGLTKLADSTEDQVRKNPLAAIGIALSAGVVLGALGMRILMPRRRTMLDRVGDYEAVKGARRLFNRIF
jgi:ElaB/YqjD/DUF883 family membrane-anchored ribosome-binding protein